MKTSIVIKLTNPMSGADKNPPRDEVEERRQAAGAGLGLEDQLVGKKSSNLPEAFGPYSDEFVTYLDRCYTLMEEVWSYKRNLESVEDFWERVVLEPDRRFAAEMSNPYGLRRPKKKSIESQTQNLGSLGLVVR